MQGIQKEVANCNFLLNGTGRSETMIRLHEMQLGIFPAAGTPFQAAAFSFSASSTQKKEAALCNFLLIIQ
jgi:hypothetical protein